MKSKIFNCAVIGLGVGMRHVNVFIKSKNTNLIAICDINTLKRNKIKKLFPKNIKIYKNFKKLVDNENLDIISIATYDDLHFEQLIYCLKKNINIIVEKPMCLKFNQLDKLFKLSFKNKILIFSNLTLRGNDYFKKIKQDILKNKYGDIYYLSGDYIYGRINKIIYGWRSKIKNYSIILGGAIHIIDLINWFKDKKVISVFTIGNKSTTNNTNFKYKDFSLIILKFEDGSIAKITANFAANLPHRHLIELHGKKKSLFLDYNKSYSFSKADLNKIELVDLKKFKYDKEFILKSNIKNILSKNYNETINQFNLMSISLSAEKSLKSGKWERVKYYSA